MKVGQVINLGGPWWERQQLCLQEHVLLIKGGGGVSFMPHYECGWLIEWLSESVSEQVDLSWEHLLLLLLLGDCTGENVYLNFRVFSEFRSVQEAEVRSDINNKQPKKGNYFLPITEIMPIEFGQQRFCLLFFKKLLHKNVKIWI